MKVLLFGASGMVGRGVLLECLEDGWVDAVLAVGRASCNVTHPKLRELIRSDFHDYRDARPELAGHEACFFCLGVSSAGMDEASYSRVTLDFTVAAAEVLAELNPGMTFCYVSGEGTDSTERGRAMWARVKGKTENRLLGMRLNAYMFRPGYIQPRKGVRSKTLLYQAFYTVLGPLYPLLKRVMPRHVTATENVGRAMIEVAAKGYSKRILENPDINALAGFSSTR
ncbi:MAG TPA: epimerase [Thermoanaerobaculia bacterium]|nr:epimerase [Thermoanaerobaculia bacterium]